MTHSGRRSIHFRAFLAMIFLIGSMLAAPVLADEPFATPVVEPDPPAPEVVPVETERQVLTDDPSGESTAPEEGLPAERVPETGAAPSLAEPEVMAAIEPLTTLYLTIAETTGRTVVFPDGQTACFSILLDPPAAHGSPYTIYCIPEIDGVAEIFGGMPDVHFTVYSVAVWSNTAACDFAVGSPAVTELGSGLSQVDIAIDADCPEDPSTPPGPLDGFGITPSDSTGLDRSYPGLLCMDVVATPPLPVPLSRPICLDASYGIAITNPLGVVFPRDTTYDLAVASNETGCTPSWSAFREEFVPPGILVVGLIDVVLTCEDDPPVPVDSYSGIGVTLTDATGVDRTYDGEICIDVAITPAVSIPGAVPQCFSSSFAQSGYPASGAILPRDSTYEGVIVSNTTGCTATWTTREEVIGPVVPVEPGDGRIEVLSLESAPLSGPLMIVIDVIIDCDDPGEEPGGDLYQVGIAFSDVRGADFTYAGEVCVEVRVDPVAGASTTGTYCTDSTFRYFLLTGEDWSHLSTSIYTTTLVSNATGCAVTIEPFQSWIGPLLPPVGHIQLWIDCDDPGEEPEPSVTATATVAVTPTAAETETPVASETVESPTPSAGGSQPVPSGTQDAGGSSGTASGTLLVATLPNTGDGDGGNGQVSTALILLAGISLVAALSGTIVRRKSTTVGSSAA